MSDIRSRILASLLNNPDMAYPTTPQNRLSDLLRPQQPNRNALPELGSDFGGGIPAWMRNLDVSGNVGQAGSQWDNTVYGNGRIGYNLPVDRNNLNVGVSGGGYRSKSDEGVNSRFGLNGVDASLETGSGDYSASYDRMNKLLQIMYKNRF